MKHLLTDEELIVEVRRLAGMTQRLPLLLLLAHVPRPAKTRSIVDKGSKIGFRKVRDWNVSSVLKSAEKTSQVVQLADGWQLLEPGFSALRSGGIDLSAPKIAAVSNSVLPKELFSNTRVYLERVVDQINGSYDYGLYDCCAVMCRRLGETLVIELYEALGRVDEIKGADGHFLMFNGLLGVLHKDVTVHLGRDAKRGLGSLKELGDKAAHNRRFNARQPDIDGIRSSFRTAVEELLHLAKLTK